MDEFSALFSREELRQARDFAEIGPGEGELSLAMLEQLPRARATLIDLDIRPSLDMMDKFSMSHRCRFVQSHIVFSGLASGQFDVIVLDEMLRHLGPREEPDWGREIVKILKPGGTILVQETVGPPQNEAQERFLKLSSFQASVDKSLGFLAQNYIDEEQARHSFDNTTVRLIDEIEALPAHTLENQETEAWLASIKTDLGRLLGDGDTGVNFRFDAFESAELQRPRKLLLVFKSRL